MTNVKKNDIKEKKNIGKKERKKTQKEKLDNNNVENNEIFKKSSIFKRKIYISYNLRFLLNIILVLLTVSCLVASFFMSFSITKTKRINYSNKSEIDYKVFLDDNEFYEKDYLNKGMAYVASLIDKINIKFDYKFDSDIKSDIEFRSKVMAKLVISSQNNSRVFYENEYEILEEEKTELKNQYNHLISKDVTIDYDYYNDLANKFKSEYAVNTNSYLEVYLLVNEKDEESNSYKIYNSEKTSLIIPLSQQEVNIGLEEKTVNNQKEVVFSPKVVIADIRFVVLDVILFIIAVFLLTNLLKKLSFISSKKSNYDKYVNKLLRGYDRLIVNVKTSPNFENYNVIKVENFDELLDVRDNIKEPIKYFVITEHQKCEFFITNNNDLYLYVVKAVDIDKE